MRPKWKENGVQTTNASWRVRSGHETAKSRQLCASKYRNLNSEATECSLCKHCGCIRINYV